MCWGVELGKGPREPLFWLQLPAVLVLPQGCFFLKRRLCWAPWCPQNASLRFKIFGVGGDVCMAGL